MAAGNQDSTSEPGLSDEYRKVYRALNETIIGLSEARRGPDLVPASAAPQRLQRAERLLCHFATMVSPIGDTATDIWTEQVAVVNSKNLDGRSVTVQEVGVSLQTLSDWNGLSTVQTINKKGRAAGTEKQTVRGYLPPGVIRQCFRQLQQLMDEFKWLPGGESTRDRYHATGGENDEYPEPFGNAEPPEDN